MTQPKSRLFLLTVLMVYPLAQLAIDLYLPAWSTLVSVFHVSHHSIQLTLTFYILALGVSQLIYGPLSDYYGRRPILFLGLSVFLLASLACVFVSTITQFYIFRILQGIGLGAGFSVASGVLADVYRGRDLAKVTSYSAMVFSISIIFAPVVGGYLVHQLGWRPSFIVMAVYCVLLMLALFLFVPETRKRDESRKMTIVSVIKAYALFACKKRFIFFTLGLTLAYAFVVSFNVISPFLFLKTFHFDRRTFGWVLGVVGFAYFFGACVNSFLLRYYSMRRCMMVGMSCVLLGLVLLSCALWIHGGTGATVIAAGIVSIFGVGLIYPNCFAGALELFDTKGTAAAIIGACAPIGTGLISAAIAKAPVDNLSLLLVVFALLWLLLLVALVMAFSEKIHPGTAASNSLS